MDNQYRFRQAQLDKSSYEDFLDTNLLNYGCVVKLV